MFLKILVFRIPPCRTRQFSGIFRHSFLSRSRSLAANLQAPWRECARPCRMQVRASSECLTKPRTRGCAINVPAPYWSWLERSNSFGRVFSSRFHFCVRQLALRGPMEEQASGLLSGAAGACSSTQIGHRPPWAMSLWRSSGFRPTDTRSRSYPSGVAWTR